MTTAKDLFDGTNLDPRAYQLRIVDKVIEYFNAGYKSTLVESPTGSGKTPMGLIMAKYFQKLGFKCGWMSASRSLLRQAEAENEVKNICSEPLVFISMFQKESPPLDILFVDEAHRDACNSAASVHNRSRPKFIIGLTATPYRADRVKLCFEKIIKDVGIAFLIKNGFLSKFNHWNLKAYTPETVVEAYLGNKGDWGKTMMFFPTIAECIQARSLLFERDIYSEIVSGSTKKIEQIQRFKNNEYNIIIGVKAISEGIDVPDLKTVFVRDASKGPTIQMCGRLFRQNPATPVKNLVQSICTKFPFVKHAKPVEQYVFSDGEWRSIAINPLIGQICNTTTMMLARTETETIQYLKNKSRATWPPKRKRK